MKIEQILSESIKKAVVELYNSEIDNNIISFQKTRKEFEGDVTLVVFPLTRFSKLSPELTAQALGSYLKINVNEVFDFNVVKGFLNLKISDQYWFSFFNSLKEIENFGFYAPSGKTVMVEYSSPNTNKPLHLGHVRNNLLGYSVAEILKANGHKVIKVNLVNDRGIHICKSMLAWQKYGNNDTPEVSAMKGDHLVGKYYVEFDKHYKAEVNALVEAGMSREEAEKKAPSIIEAQQMLLKWESGDEPTIHLWKTMNEWVYKGFNETYKKLGVDFDKIYYESETYLLGKQIVEEGLSKGVLFKKEDGSVWIDLTNDGLDQKLLLRADGTSVYMTQDLGTAVLRAEEFNFEKLIYVVGNEQEYHFKVLKLIFEKLGYDWAQGIYHLSYGMVELPHGKMKSREGTVVDADDLVDEMIFSAKEKTLEKGKGEQMEESEAQELYSKIGLGALKYYILKVDPKKKMLFNPEESIDMNGNTGPFIQYTCARINSILRKYESIPVQIGHDFIEQGDENFTLVFDEKEKELIKMLYDFPFVIKEAGNNYSPALVANYAYELTKLFNQFYHDIPVLKEENEDLKKFRVNLALETGKVLKSAMKLLGIEVPERM